MFQGYKNSLLKEKTKTSQQTRIVNSKKQQKQLRTMKFINDFQYITIKEYTRNVFLRNSLTVEELS